MYHKYTHHTIFSLNIQQVIVVLLTSFLYQTNDTVPGVAHNQWKCLLTNVRSHVISGIHIVVVPSYSILLVTTYFNKPLIKHNF